jgi:DNA anti-recombination protein RmuC
MPLSDTMKGALGGAGFTAVVAIGLASWHYYYIDKPTLEVAERTAANEEAARKRAEERASKLEEQRAAMQKQTEEIKHQFAIAKDQFISRVNEAVYDGVSKIPGSEPNKPVPPEVQNRVIVERARRIVNERDSARTGIRKVSNNLDRIYDELDSDIDELKKAIDSLPNDVRNVQTLLQKLANKWPTKVRLIEELATASLQQIGCPVQLASNP